MNKIIFYFFTIFFTVVFAACGADGTREMIVDDNTTQNNSNDTAYTSYLSDSAEYSERLYAYKAGSSFNLGSSQKMVNYEAVVTSMCYTKHEQQYNPCYVCHQNTKDDGRANKMNDGEVQNEYAFSDVGKTNHWSNLFEDRSAKIAQISDDEILDYINTDNYSALKTLLEDNKFSGYIPDLENYHLGAKAFNEDGFAKDGSGWVAFNYKPLPSTFWPVNGSTDDVLIRLAKEFRQKSDGNLSVEVYKFNLAVVEMAVKNLEQISVDGLDENIVNKDLNGDGILGIVHNINRPSHYLGGASNIEVKTFLYPQYTEFLHSVRYVGINDDGSIYNAPHMKELRYMIKTQDLSYADIAIQYDLETQDKVQGWLPSYTSKGEKGIDNKFGWWLQGFIEDAEGELRPQTFEETFFCMGCHTTLGSTIDQVFSFARKIDGKNGWGYIDLRDMLDVPSFGEEEGEILTYFKRVGGGNEFRIANDIQEKFFHNGVVDEVKVKSVNSIYELITPSAQSALKMNKSYRVLVKEQNFLYGRDGNAAPVQNVYKQITDTTPTLPKDKQYEWDIRLDWSENN